MKKIALLLVLSSLLSLGVFADEVKQVTTETLFYIKATHTVPEGAFKNFSVFNQENQKQMQEQLISFLKTCQPYNENVNINFFGFDATLNIQSKGMINDKCSYEITGKVNQMPENLSAPAGMSNSEILALEPKVNCKFTQEQLNTLADTLNEALSELSAGNISKKHAKTADETLKAIFKDGNACSLTSLTGENL